MEKYESKTVTLNRPAGDVYGRFTDLSALTPLVADKVDAWSATPDTCSFRAKGFPISLRMDERIPNRLISVVSDGGTPVAFTLQGHFSEIAAGQTAFRITLDIELNMMLKMMVGSKLQEGLDAIADALAARLN